MLELIPLFHPLKFRDNLEVGLIHRHPLLSNTIDIMTGLVALEDVDTSFQENGYYFNGNSSYLTLDTLLSWEDQEPFTVSFWCKAFTGSRFWCIHRMHFTKTQLDFRGTDRYSVTALTDPADQEWHFYCFSFSPNGDGSHTSTMMVDKTVTSTHTEIGSPLSTYGKRPLKLGMTDHSSGLYSECIMREHRIYNRVLSIPEMKALHDVTKIVN